MLGSEVYNFWKKNFFTLCTSIFILKREHPMEWLVFLQMKEEKCVFLPLKEVCEKAASEIGIRDEINMEGGGVLLDSSVRPEEMETCW